MINKIQDNLYCINANEMDNNCYIVIKNNHCIIIDPSNYLNSIKDFVSKNKLIVDAILLTHAHFDHVGCTNKLCEIYNVKVFLHEQENINVQNLDMSLSYGWGNLDLSENNIIYFNSNKLEIGEFEFKVILTSGHTSGSVVYIYLNDVFCGDTLFIDSIGRTDLPTGDQKDIFNSLRVLVKVLKNDNIILPGHSENNIKFKSVKDINPYIKHVL